MKRFCAPVLMFGLILSCSLSFSLSLSAQRVDAQGAQGAESPREVSQQAAAVPKQVLAFYYPWYGNPDTSGRWVHWSDVDDINQTIGNATHYPTLGAYDSHDPDLVAQHVRWACEIGLTGFIASWWGQNTFEDQAVPLLLDSALQCGLQITVYFETVRGSTPTPDNALTDVLYLLQQYANHPAWLRVGDKPVIFVYSRAVSQIGLDGWQQVIDQTNQQYPGGALFIGDRISTAAAQVFDGIHTYNPTGQTAYKTPDDIRVWADTTFPQWIATAGDRISCVTIIPGYDDSKLGRPEPRPITDRWDGDTYRVLWEEAIAADPNWILITKLERMARGQRDRAIGRESGSRARDNCGVRTVFPVQLRWLNQSPAELSITATLMRQLLRLLVPVVVPVLVVSLAACSPNPHPRLAIGSTAPDFTLPGIDGRAHTLSEYASARVLAIVFTCNHCPASQLYEGRLKRLDEEYRQKGVTLIAINPENPASFQLSELGYTDVGDSLADMKTRAALRHLTYPYLYDGDRQAAATAFGPIATPHIFVFDRNRTLRYEGRIDDNLRESLVKVHDARDAIEALLAGRSAGIAHTRAVGCPVRWLSTPSERDADLARAAAEPVTLDMAGPDVLKKLRGNGTGKLLLVNFWATWCGPCAAEFPDLEDTYRMYRGRSLQFVSVSENDPAEKAAVLGFLQKHHASNSNLLFATPDTYGLQAAFDPLMPAAMPFTLVIAPNGDVVYQELGALDVVRLRRAILANLPEDAGYPGHQAYWSGN